MGLKLGVPQYVLDNIDHVCLNLPDKALATLSKWYELAPQEATTDNLADSLEYVGREDIADFIRSKMWHTHLYWWIVSILNIDWRLKFLPGYTYSQPMDKVLKLVECIRLHLQYDVMVIWFWSIPLEITLLIAL